MGSGVAGAIKKAGGDVIEEEAVNQGARMPGEAIFTGAGKLPFKMVIHAAIMGQDLKTNDKFIRQSTIASLIIAEKNNIESIALPAFGTGVGGFPMTACAYIMITAARGYETRSDNIKRVQFCLFDDYGFKCFSDKLKQRP